MKPASFPPVAKRRWDSSAGRLLLGTCEMEVNMDEYAGCVDLPVAVSPAA
jgi:hypothetical protein